MVAYFIIDRGRRTTPTPPVHLVQHSTSPTTNLLYTSYSRSFDNRYCEALFPSLSMLSDICKFSFNGPQQNIQSFSFAASTEILASMIAFLYNSSDLFRQGQKIEHHHGCVGRRERSDARSVLSWSSWTGRKIALEESSVSFGVSDTSFVSTERECWWSVWECKELPRVSFISTFRLQEAGGWLLVIPVQDRNRTWHAQSGRSVQVYLLRPLN